MDQEQFRALLATPRAGTSSTPRPRQFGAMQPKRGREIAKEEFKKPEFKPREKAKFKGKKKEGEEGESAFAKDGYRDRAADRRLGKDNEFTAVEAVLEDFEARTQMSFDKEAVERQRMYLGGDAEHSVLLKGLDFQLLERMKQRQNEVSDQTIQDLEDELDKTIAGTKPPKKRSRDELLMQLKAGKQAPAEEAPQGSVDGFEKARNEGKFKAFGAKAVKEKEKRVKSVKGKEKEVLVDGKVRRKKKKVVPAVVEAAVVVPPPPSAPLPILAVLDDDEDDDIFGGAIEYKGMDSDSDDDAVPPPPPLPLPLDTAAAPKRKYFDDDDDAPATKSGPPSSVANLAATAALAAAKKNGDGEDEEQEQKPMRLQPLSGSNMPSVRALLDLDTAEMKEEQRKAKKLKFQVKAGDKREKMSAEDKANHDYQTMTAYLEKKEKRKNNPDAGDEDDE